MSKKQSYLYLFSSVETCNKQQVCIRIILNSLKKNGKTEMSQLIGQMTTYKFFTDMNSRPTELGS